MRVAAGQSPPAFGGAMKHTGHLLFCLALLLCPAAAHAAGEGSHALAAADAHGYSGQVLAKVVRHWMPPPDDVNRRVSLRLRIDAEGNLLQCEILRPSDMPEVNRAACAAASAAGNFGPTSDAAPTDVYMTFWTRLPSLSATGNKTPAQAADPAEKSPPVGRKVEPETTEKSQPVGRKIDPAAPPTPLSASQPTSQPASQPDGKSAEPETVEKPLPIGRKVEPAVPSAPLPEGKKVEPEKQEKTLPVGRRIDPAAPPTPLSASQPTSQPASQPDGKSAEPEAAEKPLPVGRKVEPAAVSAPLPEGKKVEPDTQEKSLPVGRKVEPAPQTTPLAVPQTASAKTEIPEPEAAKTDSADRAKTEAAKPAVPQAQAPVSVASLPQQPKVQPGTPMSRYMDDIIFMVRPRIIPPARVPSGKYTVGIVLSVDNRGQVTGTKLEQSSGQTAMDEAVLLAVTKVGKLSAPPDKKPHDLSLVFTVQKP